jgi:hypothetical protein
LKVSDFNPVGVIKQAKAINFVEAQAMVQPRLGQGALEIKKGHEVIVVNGSWNRDDNVGMTMIVYDASDGLYEARCQSGTGYDSYHAEAMTLLDAMEWSRENGARKGWTGITIIIIDCLRLVKAVQEKRAETYPSWRAWETIQLINRVRWQVAWTHALNIIGGRW